MHWLCDMITNANLQLNISVAMHAIPIPHIFCVNKINGYKPTTTFQIVTPCIILHLIGIKLNPALKHTKESGKVLLLEQTHPHIRTHIHTHTRTQTINK